LKEKIETICKEMYGAVGVEYSAVAEQRLEVSQYVRLLMRRGYNCLKSLQMYVALELHEGRVRQVADLHGEDSVLTQY